MSCAKCERPFRYGTEGTVTLDRKTYHYDCLSCDQCSKLYDGSFAPDQLSREVVCQECHRKQGTKPVAAAGPPSNNVEAKPTVSSCGGCGLPFDPSSRHITKKYQNREYHHNCLKCQECQSLIEGEIYEDAQGKKIFCTSCFKRRDQQSFQKQTQEKKKNQQKSVHFAEKLAETLNRAELEAYYKNDAGRMNDDPSLAGGQQIRGVIPFCAACMLPFYAGCRITQAHHGEYHYECFCCEKCSQPINGTFTMSPDGSRFQCANCLRTPGSSSSMKLCAQCQQPIEMHMHDCVEFNRRSYHAECFVCGQCHRRLNPTQTLTLHDDQPWCDSCTANGKACYSCRKAILSQFITYETRDYHPACFRCSHCQKSLENVELLCANNLQPYCVACNDELFAERCTHCRKPIPHSTKILTFDDKPYHEQCFLCAKCRRPIASKTFFKDSRGFLCTNCR